ncbi:MAG: hypothetical protein A3B91_00400 [Candidatus Yanofskybacteria bacterium RIFCSPHIGHO2_02_FULL_41_29]|uniref:Prevent-host-death protein n=1 Tax=Candidatus Yanofskybacteria bacterium RIFCSPHIGHO2_01_FULL_41_53 TaxID=1802663 RepID=A0A1F8EHR0_9BACT|nr:MAG: hypothetical protein A2650_01945 [Candidatus Yanofskybacteria bacterium RIFCSPHIGHO2_01_FULL_41_53]OGN11604.1 MAG: hypothetical protein A3B91_00400 [Candidatus Yanofskybacteria bacterium RIFCSPHIGHO2_02_FULL_41_29]OGN18673.1 MAG: hypothetical protein A3F48_02915 [Candidatus Yanofskybacteria bacterium RIFCSPHIGHO2_12_FULL_41_9]OGN22841.1 MAG: hypothetical protein A2916_01995 [Candidatus Yanofskybacteria bacterium RIFCSPLOWO2_01_FULL_41_67]OGN30108.1 MAG: hypothetical protein A3H54_03040 
MQIDELKKLIKNSTSVLVLDNGDPLFVVLDYKMYRDLVKDKGEKEIPINHSVGRDNFNGYSHHERETEILERLNKEILALKNQIEMEEKNAHGGVD